MEASADAVRSRSDGLTFKLVGLGKYAYLQAPRAGVGEGRRASVGGTSRSRANGCAPGHRPVRLDRPLTDIHPLFAQLLSPHGKKLKTGAVSTVAGQKVVAVTGGDGTLYVATTGKPYPLELFKGGSNGGNLELRPIRRDGHGDRADPHDRPAIGERRLGRRGPRRAMSPASAGWVP